MDWHTASIEQILPHGKLNQLLPVDQLPAFKTCFDLMPELDILLAISPAKIHLVIVMPRGKIDQAHLQVLHFYAHILNLMEQRIETVKILEQFTQGGVTTIA